MDGTGGDRSKVKQTNLGQQKSFNSLRLRLLSVNFQNRLVESFERLD